MERQWHGAPTPWSAIQRKERCIASAFEWKQFDFMSNSLVGSGWNRTCRRRRNESYMLEYRPTYRQLRWDVEVGSNFRKMWIPLCMGKQITLRLIGAGGLYD
jgi:hypothetical protein